MSDLQDVARSWMVEPPWQKIFKHTFDVISDYISYILIAINAIVISVRFLSVLGSGDLFCILIGVENESFGTMFPYVSGSVLGFVNYASADPKCIEIILSLFMLYLPYILIFQTMSLVITEKFSFKIPRIAGKVERFYKNIVEDSLFGKDPDVTEDMTDPKTSTESISRHRQRNEICVSLKRTQIINIVYVLKNSFKVLLILIYLIINSTYLMTQNDGQDGKCVIQLKAFPGVVASKGLVHFMCQGKKINFFLLTVKIQTFFLICIGICSIGAVIWYFYFRSVSNLLRNLHSSPLGVKTDFFFLFDCMAHNCGLESTLRVLTHSDNSFYNICKPVISVTKDLYIEEDKLKIIWKPSFIEKWRSTQTSSKLVTIESYEVTIFPAETIHNSTNISCNTNSLKNNEDFFYEAWFVDLHGGSIEYVITIACMIGKSRMKGEKVVTNLVPYGPECSQAGLIKYISSTSAELFWDPPKGEFTKYVLTIEQILGESGLTGISGDENDFYKKQISIKAPRQIENLSYKLTTYTIVGLEPGEKYEVELRTKTGNVLSRQYISDILVTQPLVPEGALITDGTPNSFLLQWLHFSGQSCLRGFQIVVSQTLDGKIIKNVAVKKSEKQFKALGLSSGTHYSVLLTALCSYNSTKTESEKAELTLLTPPEAPRALVMTSSDINSIMIAWEPPATIYKTILYSVSISQSLLNYHYSKEVPGNINHYDFTKLPEKIGSGLLYTVSVNSIIISSVNNEEVTSKVLSEIFYTKPAPPTNFLISKNNSFTFTNSETEAVTRYRITWETECNEISRQRESFLETLVFVENRFIPVSFTLPNLIPDTIYTLRLYSSLDLLNKVVESYELSVRILLLSKESIIILTNEKDKQEFERYGVLNEENNSGLQAQNNEAETYRKTSFLD